MGNDPTSSAVQETVAGQRVFVRNATGLVKAASAFDMAVFNICGNMVIPFATGLFWAYAVWPHANFPISIIIGGVLCSFTWVCWALLASTMPRTGGGYIFNSRIIHPSVGFAFDWLLFLSSILAMALWTTWLSTVALTSAFSVYGSIQNNSTAADWSTKVLRENWTFGLGLLLIFAVFALAGWSLKASLRMQNITFLVSTGGLLFGSIIMLFTSRGTFIDNFNDYAQPFTKKSDSYHWVIAEAGRQGFTSPSVAGFSTSDTLAAVFVVLTVSIWAWSSAYLAGEMRGANSASRQLKVMAGSGSTQIAIILVATVIFLHTTGTDFFSSINYLNTIGSNPLPSAPYYTLLAGLVATNPLVVGLLVGSFVLGIWAGLWELIGVTTRPIFAYAFDGVLPYKLADVDPRRHTPVFAIALIGLACVGVHYWATYDNTGFFKIWAYVGLFAFVTMAVTAISAILLPIRRPTDYARSPARYSVMGVQAVQIAGVASLFTCGVYFFLVFKYPSVLGTATLRQAWAAVAIALASGFAIFYVSRMIRERQGVKLEAAFTEIPPD
jgi:APA family basic amino acid/polyamine antiporter